MHLLARRSHVFVASYVDNAVVWLFRDKTSGVLSSGGMLKNGVAGIYGLGGAHSVAVSPDGSRVYVASEADNAITWLSRDAATGSLEYGGMLEDDVGRVDGLNGVKSVTVSPDGQHVYSASSGDSAVALFSVASCAPCDRGSMCPVDNLSRQIACAAGSFQNEIAKTSCEVCSRGSFQENQGQVSLIYFSQVYFSVCRGHSPFCF